MILDRVTITGADDSVDIGQMSDLQAEFPFVEWGILFSRSAQGQYRFPSKRWLDSLQTDYLLSELNLSAHLCGRYVRDVLGGGREWCVDYPLMSRQVQRVQLNFHTYTHLVGEEFVGSSRYIYQCDGVNDRLVHDLCFRFGGSPLFDTSGGKGELPKSWPQPWDRTYCGFAGGLGPDNVMAQLDSIDAPGLWPRPEFRIWIDMERRVRTDDDSALDFQKVRSVLEQCASLIGA